MKVTSCCLFVLLAIITTMSGHADDSDASRNGLRLGTGSLGLPDLLDIEAVSAEVYRSAYPFSDPKETPEVQDLEIRMESTEKVLSELFSGCSVDNVEQPIGVEIALVTLSYKNETREHIPIYWERGKGSLSFSFRGVRI